MSPTPERILTSRYVQVMAAMDTMPHIVARIKAMVGHGRRIAYSQRFTYTQTPPDLYVGLTVRTDRGIHEWSDDDQAGVAVNLEPGALRGFGVGVLAWNAPTEADVWKRYHAEKDRPRHPRDTTEVTFDGCMPGDFGPSRDDQIVIRHWNDDGVCTETVIGFDYGPDKEQRRENVAMHLFHKQSPVLGHAPGWWEAIEAVREAFRRDADLVLAIADGHEAP